MHSWCPLDHLFMDQGQKSRRRSHRQSSTPGLAEDMVDGPFQLLLEFKAHRLNSTHAEWAVTKSTHL